MFITKVDVRLVPQQLIGEREEKGEREKGERREGKEKGYKHLLNTCHFDTVFGYITMLIP